MPLHPCPECSASVSSSAAACPHCGYLLRQPWWISFTHPRAATPAENRLTWATAGAALLYLLVYGIGLANCRHAHPAELLILGLPLWPVLATALWLRVYRSATIAALVTIALFLLLVVGFLGPYLFGSYADSPDGAGIGLGTGLVFLWQWWLAIGFLVVAGIGVHVERKRLVSARRRRQKPIAEGVVKT
jgi:hypothetical protein